MGTKITYRQITLSPLPADGSDEISSAVIPHISSGYIQIPQVDFIGGGSDRRFLCHVLTFEPVPDEDEDRAA